MHHGMSNTASALVQVVVLLITGILLTGTVVWLCLCSLYWVSLRVLILLDWNNVHTETQHHLHLYWCSHPGTHRFLPLNMNAMMADLSVSDADDELTLLYTPANVPGNRHGSLLRSFSRELLFTKSVRLLRHMDSIGVFHAWSVPPRSLHVRRPSQRPLGQNSRANRSILSVMAGSSGISPSPEWLLSSLFSMGAAAIYTLVELL